MKKVLIILLNLLPLMLMADEVRFSLSVSSTRISMQDYLQVQYLIENSRKVSQFVPPVFKSFTVVEGPEQATGFNMENGNLKEYVSFTYLLKADREGKFTIPAATAKVDGKSYRSNTVEVVVTKSLLPGFPEDKAIMDEIILRKGETIEGKIRNNIFVRLDVDRRSVFVGEPVVATYKLYTRLRSESRVTRRPSFNGFSVYDMANPENGESTREVFQGRDYNVYLLRKVQLYPLRSGTLELESAEVENDVSFVREELMGSGYGAAEILRDLSTGSSNSGAVVRHKAVFSSEPVQITVKPLPSDNEEDQTGAVGRFTLRSFVKAEEIHRNDVVDLHIQVAGKGNFPMITSPEMKWPEDVDVFEVDAAENYNKFVSPLSGSKLFTIPFTPKKEGLLKIPAVELRYFDPEKGVYVTATSEPLEVNVLPVRAVKKESVKEEKPANAWKYILSALGIIAVSGGVYLLMKRGTQQPTAPAVQASNAERGSEVSRESIKDPLEQIRVAFDRGDPGMFYRQLSIVIDDCMMNKYQVDGRSDWEQGLAQKGVDASTITEIRELKKAAELAMYTPFVMEAKMVEDLARIERIVC